MRLAGWWLLRHGGGHDIWTKSPRRNKRYSWAADPSRLAALLVGYIPTGMRPPRALPAGRLDAPLCNVYFFAASNGEDTEAVPRHNEINEKLARKILRRARGEK